MAKAFPLVEHSFEPLKSMLYGAVPSRLLLTGIELDVFSHLEEPTCADALASRIDTHPRNTQLFLDALVSNGLLHKREGRYWNAPLASEFLVPGTQTYLGALFENHTGYLQPLLEGLTTLVREGPPPPRGKADPSELMRETEVHANHQRAGRAQQAAVIVSQLPEFGRMKKMLDLGGGAGLIGMAIVSAHPSMRGVVFDRPEVVEVARRFIDEYELQDRVTVMGGDYREDPIGSGYDLVWASFTLMRSSFEPVIRRIHDALAPGGVYVSISEGLTDERTKPTMMINSLLSVSLRHSGLLFEEGELARAMLDAGFRSVRTRTMEGPQLHGPAELNIARK